mgnify:CR=1 FL=1
METCDVACRVVGCYVRGKGMDVSHAVPQVRSAEDTEDSDGICTGTSQRKCAAADAREMT